jgi:hypothetical protein
MSNTSILMGDILQLEGQLKNLNPHSEINCSVTTRSVGELAALAQEKRFKKLKVFGPFEHSPLQNYYFFMYHLEGRPNTIITIKSKEIELVNPIK